jgi:2-(1,2-epoxy-1,2-dihydrophenyl)acetyl-CoA isomerase
VQGPAAGIGCSLALAADLCIAAEGAYFLQAFVNIALVPDGGSSWLLPRLVGRARALEMMMLGERISSSKAEQWGLIHKVVADKDLHAAGLALAGRLARGPTQALALIRQGVRSSFTEDLSVAFFREARDQRIARQTRDAAEGTEAFVQKRRPVFTGT